MLYSRLGPQIRSVVSGPTVRLAALGKAVPLAFDINTVQEGVLRLIPGITEAEVHSWLAKRLRTLGTLQFPSASRSAEGSR